MVIGYTSCVQHDGLVGTQRCPRALGVWFGVIMHHLYFFYDKDRVASIAGLPFREGHADGALYVGANW